MQYRHYIFSFNITHVESIYATATRGKAREVCTSQAHPQRASQHHQPLPWKLGGSACREFLPSQHNPHFFARFWPQGRIQHHMAKWRRWNACLYCFYYYWAITFILTCHLCPQIIQWRWQQQQQWCCKSNISCSCDSNKEDCPQEDVGEYWHGCCCPSHHWQATHKALRCWHRWRRMSLHLRIGIGVSHEHEYEWCAPQSQSCLPPREALWGWKLGGTSAGHQPQMLHQGTPWKHHGGQLLKQPPCNSLQQYGTGEVTTIHYCTYLVSTHTYLSHDSQYKWKVPT